jgi:hypothetical protein
MKYLGLQEFVQVFHKAYYSTLLINQKQNERTFYKLQTLSDSTWVFPYTL